MNEYIYSLAYFKVLLVLCIVLFPVRLAWGKWGRKEALTSHLLLHLKDIKGVLIQDMKIISYT